MKMISSIDGVKPGQAWWFHFIHILPLRQRVLCSIVQNGSGIAVSIVLYRVKLEAEAIHCTVLTAGSVCSKVHRLALNPVNKKNQILQSSATGAVKTLHIIQNSVG